MLFQRTFITISTLLMAVVAGSVGAQSVVMQLKYDPAGGGAEKTCIFTTNGAVTMNSDTSLAAKGTFGTDCPTTVVTPPGTPSFRDTLEGDIPASVTTGATLSLNWRADADYCTTEGSLLPVTYAGWPVNATTPPQICNSAATCDVAHPQSFTASVNGTYKFQLKCYKNNNATPVTSTVSTVASTIPQGCSAPAGLTRQLFAEVCDAGGTVCRGSVDVTKFENVFGYNAAGGSPTLWPGRRNLQQRMKISNNNFVALQYTVPSTYPSGANGRYGYFTLVDTNYFGTTTIKISKTCGDLAPTSAISPNCILNNANGASTLFWSTYTSGPDFLASCALVPGETYYMHVIHADLSNPGTSTCPLGICGNSIQNGPGNF